MNVQLHANAAKPAEYPRDGLPEVAVLGRSNVGKSSFINALLGRKRLARTSSTPGKTRRVHFYRIEDAAYLVDLPGFGYAAVAKTERASWRPMVEAYLRGERAPLRGALLLVDARRGLRDEERELLAWLAAEGVPARIVLTKADKLKRNERARALAAAREEFAGDVVAVSALKREGLGAVAAWIREWTGLELVAAGGSPLA